MKPALTLALTLAGCYAEPVVEGDIFTACEVQAAWSAVVASPNEMVPVPPLVVSQKDVCFNTWGNSTENGESFTGFYRHEGIVDKICIETRSHFTLVHEMTHMFLWHRDGWGDPGHTNELWTAVNYRVRQARALAKEECTVEVYLD